MAFAILCDRCGKIIIPGASKYASFRCTKNEIMNTFVFCESCADKLKHWITGNEMEDGE